jgi:hypothetical protein
MTLAASGSISLGQIRTEYGMSGSISMSELYRGGSNVTDNNTGVAASGTITLGSFRGSGKRYEYTITSNQQELNIATYLTGQSHPSSNPAKVTINNVYVWSDSTSTAGLTIPSSVSNFALASPHSTVGLSIVNSGKIIGRGGNGAAYNGSAQAGGPAISNSATGVEITNNSSAYIAGGGGGGGSGKNSSESNAGGGGGGGAGGGTGGAGYDNALGVRSGGSGGAIGASGSNGTNSEDASSGKGGGSGGGGGGYDGDNPFDGADGAGGGGGGRILPGTGGAGGTRTGNQGSIGTGGTGGSGSSSGGSESGFFAGGGGGGWGAAGGNGDQTNGAAGGAAISGTSVTLTDNGTIYGSTV